MKKIILFLPFILVLVFQITSCKTLFTEEGRLYRQAKTLVRQKKYDHAISNLSIALQIDPEYKNAVKLIDEIFPESQSYYLRLLKNMEQKDTLEVLDRRASIYTSLNTIYRAMSNLPQLIHPKTKEMLSFKLTDYSKQMDEAVHSAAEGYYQEGLRLAGNGNRTDAKAASKAFLKALEYIPDYKDAVSREAAARNRAIQAVVFLPFRGLDYTISDLNANEYILDTIVAKLSSDKEVMEYTKIVDQSQLEPILQSQQLALSGLFDDTTSVEIGKLVSANLIFSGKTNQISYDEPVTTHKVEHRKREVPAAFDDLGREPLEGETVTVEADIDIFKKTTSARILISYKLLDIETSTVLLSDSLNRDTEDSISWAAYQGDERALNEKDLELVSKGEGKAADASELISEGLRYLGMEVAAKLKSYLK